MECSFLYILCTPENCTVMWSCDGQVKLKAIRRHACTQVFEGWRVFPSLCCLSVIYVWHDKLSITSLPDAHAWCGSWLENRDPYTNTLMCALNQGHACFLSGYHFCFSTKSLDGMQRPCWIFFSFSSCSGMHMCPLCMCPLDRRARWPPALSKAV